MPLFQRANYRVAVFESTVADQPNTEVFSHPLFDSVIGRKPQVTYPAPPTQ